MQKSVLDTLSTKVERLSVFTLDTIWSWGVLDSNVVPGIEHKIG